MQFYQDQIQRQSQRIAPHQIQANLLLQCSAQELLQVIAQEQQENPALEDNDVPEDTPGCPYCPPYGQCAQCAQRHEEQTSDTQVDVEAVSGDDAAGGADAAEERLALRAEMERLRADPGLSQSAPGEGEFDPLLLARAPSSLADQLLTHLRATARSAAEVAVSEYLVDSLDEFGYLRVDEDEACAVLQVPCSLILEGIRRLQDCDPPGIGARDLRECLQLQMRARREEADPDEYDPIAEALLRNHWDALLQRRNGHLARSLDVSLNRLDAAVQFIRQRLIPHPAAQYRAPWDHCPNTQSMAVRPDVLIRRTQSGFVVEVTGMETLDLQVNSHYRRLYEQAQSATTEIGAVRTRRRASDHEKHVIAFVERADLFLKNLHLRRRTIQRITEAIIEQQQGFLETGKRVFLRPMTRTRLAQQVGMHESTVSRALLHKFVQLPSQEVVPFDIFFENAVSVKDAVAALIAEESPEAPLTDQALTALLRTRGFVVARRTVVKYREELRLPASYLRRRR